ncbi:MAG: S8 family serine peptidase, partial [Verrucomicrobiae bacterium]|nr:S8 family serine peptidase [Verrucomicrobiae bacterium]
SSWRHMIRLCIVPAWLALATASATASEFPESLIYSGNHENGVFESLDFVNSVTGWDLFFNSGFRGGSTVVGNIEAGHVWSGHEAFVREPGALNGITIFDSPAAGALDELDFHATMVGHVLAGSGYIPDNGGSYTYLGLGMAPEAALVSGAVATGFSTTEAGSFTTTTESVVTVYESFFTGSGVAKPDVINSSWGGSDPAAASDESLAIDGLARQNASVALVVSAGNGGSAVVGAPASGFNNISVGSLGGADFLQPSTFSSRGTADLYNPVTDIVLNGVRPAVDIAAPGERMVLAAYLGGEGGIGAAIPGIVEDPVPTDQYFLNMDGTSFSAPIVAGGISLLKDAANTLLAGNSEAMDTRVVKSVLMASSTATAGWDNGQDAMNVTTQALDFTTGAGAMNLVAAADVFYFGTTGIAGDHGGAIAESGWDTATISLGDTIDWVFSSEFTQEMSVTVALNWFSVREFDGITDTGSDLAFSNLDLELWSVDAGGSFLSRIGASLSDYNNTEFLRIDSLTAGRYGFRVRFDEMIFDTTNTIDSEYLGLAWNAVVVPEPACAMLSLFGALLMVRRRR